MIIGKVAITELINKLWLQFIFLGLAIVLIFFEAFGSHPLLKLITFISEAGEKYRFGFLVIAGFSFLENLIFVNVLFPGAIVILATMSMTYGHPLKAIITFFCIYLPSVFAHIINYFLGKHTSKKTDAIEKTHLAKWFFLNMCHPNFASLYTYRAGNSNLIFKDFLKYFLPFGFLWYSFYGIIMYEAGNIVSDIRSAFPTVFIIYIFYWTTKSLLKTIKSHNRL